MKLNNYSVVNRHNRPSVSQRVLLEAHFLNNGVYQDPYDISGVTIFAASDNYSPSSILGSDNLVASSTSSLIRMQFEGIEDASSYTPSITASSIYKISTGKYGVVLDGILDLSGNISFWGGSSVIANSASAVLPYIDVWTVKQIAGSTYNSYINQFSLFDDTFFTLTQPLLIKTNNKLTTKHIEYGSKTDVKVTTEVIIENKDIDDSIRNIFNRSIITDATMQIKKLNQGQSHLPCQVTVSSFDDTDGYIDITSDNTLKFNWDTSLLSTHPEIVNFGGIVGVYSIQVKYTIGDETIYSPIMYLSLT